MWLPYSTMLELCLLSQTPLLSQAGNDDTDGLRFRDNFGMKLILSAIAVMMLSNKILKGFKT